ncbi:hypothetical protein [Pseudomonas nitroreducens]|uniref:hypothetical protein n=1 Tax=Pseudomonas nitroreducens TaxID=46680 RepID=UPI001130BA96|nr:hypothetical protein [Pseudomonas nitroreducens]
MKDILLSAASNLLNFVFSKGSMVAAGILASHLTSIENTQTLSIIIATISAFGTLFQQSVSTASIRYSTQKIIETARYRNIIIALLTILSIPVSIYLYTSHQLSKSNSILILAILVSSGISGKSLANATIQKEFLKISLIGIAQGITVLSLTTTIMYLDLSPDLYTIPFLLASAFWLLIKKRSSNITEKSTTIATAISKTLFPAIFTGIFFLPTIWMLTGYIQNNFGDKEAFLLTTANQWRMTIGILPSIFGGYLLLLITKKEDLQNSKTLNCAITYYPAILITIVCSIMANHLGLIYPESISENTNLEKTINLFILASVITTLKTSISREMIAAELAVLSIISNLTWAILFCCFYFFTFHQDGAYGVSKSFLASQVTHLTLWIPIIIKKKLIPMKFIDKKFLASIIPLAWILYKNAT